MNEAGQAAEATVRIPANLMALVRQSYDTREKVRDWLLAIGGALAMAYAFRSQLCGLLAPAVDPNAGRDGPVTPQPGDDGSLDRRSARLYTYNMPSSRDIAFARVASGTRLPTNPSVPVTFAED